MRSEWLEPFDIVSALDVPIVLFSEEAERGAGYNEIDGSRLERSHVIERVCKNDLPVPRFMIWGHSESLSSHSFLCLAQPNGPPSSQLDQARSQHGEISRVPDSFAFFADEWESNPLRFLVKGR